MKLFRRRSRPSIRRNLLWVGLVLALFFLLIVGVQKIRLTPILIFPDESKNSLQRRQSPDNAYFLLEQAEKQMSALPFNPQNLADPDDCQKVMKYLQACAPAFEKIREALQKPYFLTPEDSTVFDYAGGVSTDFGRFLQVMAAQSWAALHCEKDEQKAREYVRDTIRLSEWFLFDYFYFSNTMDSMITAYAVCRDMAENPSSPQGRDQVQTFLTDLGPPFKDRTGLLKKHWRRIDSTQLRPTPPAYADFPRNLFVHLSVWEMRSFAQQVLKNQAVYLEMVNKNMAAFNQWKAQNPDQHGGPLEWVGYVLNQTLPIQQEYHCTVLVTALERFHAVHAAYPEQLEQLVPDFLPELPRDVYCGEPYEYRRDQRRYALLTPSSPEVPERPAAIFYPKPEAPPGPKSYKIKARVVQSR